MAGTTGSGAHGVFDAFHPSKQAGSRKYPRIALPVERMRDSYDVVVIGSGYGGAVAASRMARGRQSVCVLEVGKERWPGEFPESTADAMKELNVSGEYAPGDRRGKEGHVVASRDPTKLYHFVVGDGQNAFVANGLGGTSLLNANVFLEAHWRVLDLGVWPKELRGRDKWHWYYERARQMLQPEPYPENFPELPKLNLLRHQAERMGWGQNFYRVPQTTRFVSGRNSTGVSMNASTLTGMDATGINDGSKSTTLVTYLSDAWNWGAEMFCECEVRHIETAPPGREGYIVYFAWHGRQRDKFKEEIHQDLMWVHAKKFVFLGAGSLGSTEILLRSREMGLDISDDVGTEMSGNGDMLAFGYNTDFDANAVGNPNPSPDRPVGPCITGVIDLRDQQNLLDGFVIEDCATPKALEPILLPMFEKLQSRDVRGRLAGLASKTASRLGAKALGPTFEGGSVQKTTTYLVMSHDSSQAHMTLEEDHPVLRYSGVGRSESVSRINKLLMEATAAIGGTFVPNPAAALLGDQQITVHPIGGARISKDGTGNSGVVNHAGEVFVGNTSTVYDGLVVCDGAIVPAALGVNPFATITALAERSVELVALKHGIYIDYQTQNGDLDLFGRPRFPLYPEAQGQNGHSLPTEVGPDGFSFTEIMSGFITTNSRVRSFWTAEKIARGRSEAARVYLTVTTDNLQQMQRDESHRASLTGTFTCPSLGGPFMVRHGRFQLFSNDPRKPDTKNFVYDFDIVSTSGQVLHFNGYKDVGPAVAFNVAELWRATTTLFTTITTTEGVVLGRGILRISPEALASQAQTLESEAPSLLKKAASSASFLSLFFREAMHQFLGPFGAPPEFDALHITTTTQAEGGSDVKSTRLMQVVAADGVSTNLGMWDPLTAASVPDYPNAADTPQILFLPGAAVDHQVFALPTIPVSTIAYFRKAGFRVYCLTHRIGLTPEARRGHTTYDVRLDIAAALEWIRKSDSATYGRPLPTYVVAHCAGSIGLASGLLDGTIPSHWIAGITASNVFMHPRFAKTNYVLASLSLAPTAIFEKMGDAWYDCNRGGASDNVFQQFLTRATRAYPVGSADETCTSDVCHRSSLCFGRLWSHRNLNAQTHAYLPNLLGGTTIRSLSHLMAMGTSATALTDTRQNLVTPSNLSRLRGVPILFISGAENSVFAPESTDMSYTTLCNAHGREWYEREVFEGKGHLDCWMGAEAWRDVYPRVERHVRGVLGGKGE
ncbi:hypothetical protein OQA88_9171 [Cercophora sp. LCS_1]